MGGNKPARHMAGEGVCTYTWFARPASAGRRAYLPAIRLVIESRKKVCKVARALSEHKRRTDLSLCLCGNKYYSEIVGNYLKRHDFRQSMEQRCSCYDNAIMETFFSALKSERVHFEKYESRMQAMVSLFDYIERFYNRQRRHSALKYKIPEEYELLNKHILLN